MNSLPETLGIFRGHLFSSQPAVVGMSDLPRNTPHVCIPSVLRTMYIAPSLVVFIRSTTDSLQQYSVPRRLGKVAEMSKSASEPRGRFDGLSDLVHVQGPTLIIVISWPTRSIHSEISFASQWAEEPWSFRKPNLFRAGRFLPSLRNWYSVWYSSNCCKAMSNTEHSTGYMLQIAAFRAFSGCYE